MWNHLRVISKYQNPLFVAEIRINHQKKNIKSIRSLYFPSNHQIKNPTKTQSSKIPLMSIKSSCFHGCFHGCFHDPLPNLVKSKSRHPGGGVRRHHVGLDLFLGTSRRWWSSGKIWWKILWIQGINGHIQCFLDVTYCLWWIYTGLWLIDGWIMMNYDESRWIMMNHDELWWITIW